MVNRPKHELKQDAVDIRRDRVWELSSKGYSIRAIANMLQISHGTVGNDLVYLRDRAKENIKNLINQKLPEEYEKVLNGLTAILKEAWDTAENTEDNREKLQALSLAKEVYNTKLDMLTNASVIDDAIKLVEQHSHSYVNNNNNNESKNESEKEVKEEPTTNEVF